MHRLLTAIAAESHEEVLRAICNICQSSDDVRQQVVDLGDLVPLVGLFASTALPAVIRRAAAQKVFRAFSGSQVIADPTSTPDCIRQLISVLNSSSKVLNRLL